MEGSIFIGSSQLLNQLVLSVRSRSASCSKGHSHMWFLRQFWEAFLHNILPTLSILHVSWMFRMNGISSVVPVADCVYRLTFDICNRVVPKSPGTPRSFGSSLWRIIEYNIHSVKSWCVVRVLRVPERFFVFFLTLVPSHIPKPQGTASTEKSEADWENPEVVGRCKR